MNRLTLSAKLFAWILLCAMLPSILLAGLYLNAFKDSLLQQEKEHLSQLADKKVKQIEDFIEERISDALLLARSLETENTFTVLQPLYVKNSAQSKQYFKQEKYFRDFFYRFQERGYYDIFLISIRGEIIFSLEHESDFTTNIYHGPYKNSGLNQVARRARYFLESSSSTFEDYPPSQEAAAFIAAPVLRNGQLLGVVALQVDTDIIQRVIKDVSGFMLSREVVVTSKNKTHFSFQGKLKYSSDVIIGKELPFSELTKPIKKSLNGIRDVAIEDDYRNTKVIAASRYIPSMQWGMVFKEDLAEAMMVFDQLLIMTIIILIILLLALLLIAGLLGRTIAKPLVAMTNATRAMAQGDMHLRIKQEGYKESYELAKYFNHMSERLTEARDTLEQKVEDRTVALKSEITLRQTKELDLEKTNDELHHSMKKLKAAQTQIIESEKMASLGSLVAGIAHEINTPLGVAITSTSLFRDEINTIKERVNSNALTKKDMLHSIHQLQEIALLIEANLNRTDTLVKNFKQVAVDQSNMHKGRFQLHELVESLLISLYPETKKHPVKIENVISDHIIIDSYSGDFYQLLTNLILNAMIHAFHDKEHGSLVIDASTDKNNLTLKVSDDGHGIEKENSLKIFEPFFTTRRSEGGSGLGLSVVYNIVTQKLNGTIKVKTEKCKGCEFIIICPVAVESKDNG